jgi:hypothetical protein
MHEMIRPVCCTRHRTTVDIIAAFPEFQFILAVGDGHFADGICNTAYVTQALRAIGHTDKCITLLHEGHGTSIQFLKRIRGHAFKQQPVIPCTCKTQGIANCIDMADMLPILARGEMNELLAVRSLLHVARCLLDIEPEAIVPFRPYTLDMESRIVEVCRIGPCLRCA